MITLVTGGKVPKDSSYDISKHARKFWRLSYEGGPQYVYGVDARNNAILQSFRRENSTLNGTSSNGGSNERKAGYHERLARATLKNFLKTTIDKYVSYVFKDEITRPTEPQSYVDYLQNFDGCFTPVDKFMRSTLREGLILGTTYLLCQAVSNTPVVTVQQARLNLQFKVTSVCPDRIIYKDVENGLVNEAIIELSCNSFLYVSAVEFIEFEAVNGTITLVQPPEYHNFGQCPLIAFTVDTLTPNLAEQQKTIFNYMSLLDEESFSCTYSQQYFTGVDPSSLKDNKDIAVGSDRILFLPVQAGQASANAGVLGADTDQAESLRKSIAAEVCNFYRVAGLPSPDPLTNNAPESGVAKAFNMAEIEGRLAGFAAECERVETLITEFWEATTANEVDGEISYPAEYGITSIDDQIDRLTKLGIEIPNILKRKQVLEMQRYEFTLTDQELADLNASLLIKYPDETVGSITSTKSRTDVSIDRSAETKVQEQITQRSTPTT